MLSIKEMPITETPEYRAKSHGVGTLATYELLQLVYSFKHIDTAQQLMAKAGSLQELAGMTCDEMQTVEGLGPKAALAIKAALELGERLRREQVAERAQFRSPADIAALCWDIQRLEQEVFEVLLLDTKNRLIERKRIYSGTVNCINIRLGEVFREAVRRNAVSLVMVHNHPSGDPTPSPQDVNLTALAVEAGKLLDVQVLDHVVIGNNRYVSMKERGLGFS